MTIPPYESLVQVKANKTGLAIIKSMEYSRCIDRIGLGRHVLPSIIISKVDVLYVVDP